MWMNEVSKRKERVKKLSVSWGQWCMPIVPALWKLRQEDGEFNT
jgi:hypothetical protein